MSMPEVKTDPLGVGREKKISAGSNGGKGSLRGRQRKDEEAQRESPEAHNSKKDEGPERGGDEGGFEQHIRQVRCGQKWHN